MACEKSHYCLFIFWYSSLKLAGIKKIQPPTQIWGSCHYDFSLGYWHFPPLCSPLLVSGAWHRIPDLGIKDLILLCVWIFLLLALLTLIISMTTLWLNSFKSSQVYLKEKEEKNEKRQKLVRKNQEAQDEKASRYIKNVLKPHQEMKFRKLEESFIRC